MQILQTKSVELQALPYKGGGATTCPILLEMQMIFGGVFFWKMNKTFGVRHSGLYYANGIN